MTEEDVVKLIDEAGDFPGLSPLAADIARMTSDLSAPVQEIAERIQSDASVLEKMLRIVKSPFYGLTGDVTDLSKAISLIGYKKICNLVVGISVLDQFPPEAGGFFDYAKFWTRSIFYGAAAGEVATRLSSEFPLDLFTAGLLQDIGVIFLVRYRPLEYGGAMGVSLSKKEHIVKAEREVLGVDHALVGAMLGKKWGLPSLLTDVIQQHHFAELGEPPSPGIRKIVQVVNLSDVIAETLLGEDEDQARKTLDSRGREFFGFGPKMIESVLEKVPDLAREVGEVFSLKIGAGAGSPAKEPEERLEQKCPKCGVASQGGKFCSECGASMVVKEAPPVRDTKKILLAEDSIASRRALSFVIKKLGYIPVEATNGHEAVELAKRDPPGMILLDVMMPHMNGLEALKQIRGEKSTAHIPVVMLTSLTDSETVVEAVQSGANDYVVKPYTADIIQDRIRKFMPKPKKRKR